MQAASQARSMPTHPAPDASGDGQGRPVPLVESAELLKGNKAVGILHNGSLYRLQATRFGKLILTK